MFKKVKKIILSKKDAKANAVIVVCQRSQCRITHKRQDC